MSDAIERILRINRADVGHGRLTVRVTDAPGVMPIMLSAEPPEGDEPAVYLRWSEWDEVRDHIELCATMARPEPADPTPNRLDTPGMPDSVNAYALCGAGPGLVPYEPLPCVLERGHDAQVHIDRQGRTWGV